MRRVLDAMSEDGSLDAADLPRPLHPPDRRRVRPIDVLYITGHWLDVDDAFDLASLRNLV